MHKRLNLKGTESAVHSSQAKVLVSMTDNTYTIRVLVVLVSLTLSVHARVTSFSATNASSVMEYHPLYWPL